MNVVFRLLHPDKPCILVSIEGCHKRQHTQRTTGNPHLVHRVLEPRFFLHEINPVFRLSRFDFLGKTYNLPGCRYYSFQEFRR